MDALIALCVDICKRNGIARINFTGDDSGNLTMHRYYKATACPGTYLASKFSYIAEEVNKKLQEDEPMTAAEKKEFEALRKTVAELTAKVGAKGDKPSGWAADAWSWAKTAGITDGTSPQGLITREQVVTMLWRVAQGDENAKAWAQAALNELDAFDIMDSDNPHQLVSREVLAVVISRLIAKTKNGEIKTGGN